MNPNSLLFSQRERVVEVQSRGGGGGGGGGGGVMVLGKFSVPGRPASLENSRARDFCACSRCGRGLFELFFLSLIFFLFFLPLWETARYRLKYCLKGSLNPK